MRSKELSFRKGRSLASATRTSCFDGGVCLNCSAVLASLIASGLISRPRAFRPSSFASMSVVPAPTIGSRIEWPEEVYISMMLRGT